MSETIRTRRVAELIKQEIASIIDKDVHDPRVKNVIITQVRVTKDLGIARILFSSYDLADLQDIEIGLNKSKGFIRKMLMGSVHLKKLPQLVFERDMTTVSVDRLDELFKQIESEKGIEE